MKFACLAARKVLPEFRHEVTGYVRVHGERKLEEELHAELKSSLALLLAVTLVSLSDAPPSYSPEFDSIPDTWVQLISLPQTSCKNMHETSTSTNHAEQFREGQQSW